MKFNVSFKIVIEMKTTVIYVVKVMALKVYSKRIRAVFNTLPTCI